MSKKNVSRREYHALTRGMILQEVFRRAEPDNKTLGQFLAENVFTKLGVGVHIGLRPEDQERLKIADCVALSRQEVILQCKMEMIQIFM